MDFVLALSIWIVLFGLNLLLTWSRSAHELEAAAVLVTVATWFAMTAHRVRSRDMRVRPAPKVLLSPWPRFATESWSVGQVLARVALRGAGVRPVGNVSLQPFDEGGRNGLDNGRRALVVLSGSVTPNGFALHLPEGGERIVMHRLVPESPSADCEWPT